MRKRNWKKTAIGMTVASAMVIGLTFSATAAKKESSTRQTEAAEAIAAVQAEEQVDVRGGIIPAGSYNLSDYQAYVAKDGVTYYIDPVTGKWYILLENGDLQEVEAPATADNTINPAIPLTACTAFSGLGLAVLFSKKRQHEE